MLEQGSLPPECANACAVVHVSSAAGGETSCRLLVFGGSVSDGVPVRHAPLLIGLCSLPSHTAQAMRVRSIDYGAFIRAQAVPAAAAVLHQANQLEEQPVSAPSATATGSSAEQPAAAEEVVTVKTDAEKQRPKIDGAVAEKKTKAGAAASKGAPSKRNK